jgi:hypothetical protein
MGNGDDLHAQSIGDVCAFMSIRERLRRCEMER